MATHIVSAEQAVNEYMSGVRDEAFRIKTLLKDWGDFDGAAEQVRGCIGPPNVFGSFRDGSHNAGVDDIAEELKRRARKHGIIE